MRIPIQAGTVHEVREAAKRISRQHPGKYCTIQSCFGLYIAVSKRLHVFAPSDAPLLLGGVKAAWYYLNGHEKPFTRAQVAEDWRRTPTMA